MSSAVQLELEAGRERAFANFELYLRAWYVVARSEDVRVGRARSFDLLGRRVVVWRDSGGAPHAAHARCPHLGSDLGLGSVVDGRLRCAFHHWSFGADGCRAEDARSPHLVVYPIAERFGLLWLFNARSPDGSRLALPNGDDESDYWQLRPPAQRIACHPHLVIANGLDASHFATLHGMEHACEPRLEVGGERELVLHLQGRPRSRFLRSLTGTRREPFRATFRTVGGHLAWSTISAPVRFHVLFTARPGSGRTCITQTVLFLPRGRPLASLRALALVALLLRNDRRVLDRLDFHPGFTPADAPLRRFAEIVDALPCEP